MTKKRYVIGATPNSVSAKPGGESYPSSQVSLVSYGAWTGTALVTVKEQTGANCAGNKATADFTPGITVKNWPSDSKQMTNGVSVDLVFQTTRDVSPGPYHYCLQSDADHKTPVVLNVVTKDGSIRGKIWEDINGDGVKDANENFIDVASILGSHSLTIWEYGTMETTPWPSLDTPTGYAAAGCAATGGNYSNCFSAPVNFVSGANRHQVSFSLPVSGGYVIASYCWANSGATACQSMVEAGKTYLEKTVPVAVDSSRNPVNLWFGVAKKDYTVTLSNPGTAVTPRPVTAGQNIDTNVVVAGLHGYNTSTSLRVSLLSGGSCGNALPTGISIVNTGVWPGDIAAFSPSPAGDTKPLQLQIGEGTVIGSYTFCVGPSGVTSAADSHQKFLYLQVGSAPTGTLQGRFFNDNDANGLKGMDAAEPFLGTAGSKPGFVTDLQYSLTTSFSENFNWARATNEGCGDNIASYSATLLADRDYNARLQVPSGWRITNAVYGNPGTGASCDQQWQSGATKTRLPGQITVSGVRMGSTGLTNTVNLWFGVAQKRPEVNWATSPISLKPNETVDIPVTLKTRHGWAGTIDANNLILEAAASGAVWNSTLPGGTTITGYYLDAAHQQPWIGSTFLGTVPGETEIYGEGEKIIHLLLAAPSQLATAWTGTIRIRTSALPGAESSSRGFSLSSFDTGGFQGRFFNDENENGQMGTREGLFTTATGPANTDYSIQYKGPTGSWQNLASSVNDGCTVSGLLGFGSPGLAIPAQIGGGKYSVRFALTSAGQTNGWKVTGAYYREEVTGDCSSDPTAEAVQRDNDAGYLETRYTVKDITFGKDQIKNLWFGVAKKDYTVSLDAASYQIVRNPSVSTPVIATVTPTGAGWAEAVTLTPAITPSCTGITVSPSSASVSSAGW
ncbi:MAG: hypothetical protein WC645_08850, partial [Candidatus Margulisiibacteriota bacterium]